MPPLSLALRGGNLSCTGPANPWIQPTCSKPMPVPEQTKWGLGPSRAARQGVTAPPGPGQSPGLTGCVNLYADWNQTPFYVFRVWQRLRDNKPAQGLARTVQKLPPRSVNDGGGTPSELERVKGIEPSYVAWEAAVLPLNYTRAADLPVYASPG